MSSILASAEQQPLVEAIWRERVIEGLGGRHAAPAGGQRQEPEAMKAAQ
jgi:hypothetical protein